MAVIAKQNPTLDDQHILNKVIRNMDPPVSYHTLDSTKFLCGKNYYEEPKRYFADTAKECYGCIVVHNNWIIGKAAKVYRQREMLQWTYDGEKYYSDPNRKYLWFTNISMPNYNDKQQLEEDKYALMSAFAIGEILNRVVIIPRLSCNGMPCPLNSRYNITQLDLLFRSKYRESTFLLHPKVPESVKKSVSETYGIQSSYSYSNPAKSNVIILTPSDPDAGATSDEILEWFGENKESVLKFETLHKAFKGFMENSVQVEFERKVASALKIVTYMQRGLNEKT